MSVRQVRLGISPCPNDVFVFDALLRGLIAPRGFELDIRLHDVQELNERYAARELDASKTSFAAAFGLPDTLVLSTGSALGFGVGPLLLARAGAPPLADARVLCPGAATTAHLLYRLFHAGAGRVEHVVFSAILPALEAGRADYGVCIHEGRFTYERHGLVRVEDLGTTWERATRRPLPLGGIVARTSLGEEILRELDDVIRASLDHALAHPDTALATAREHAVEMEESVLRAHVELYVNDWTRDLGPEGEEALIELHAAALRTGLVRGSDARLRIRPRIPG